MRNVSNQTLKASSLTDIDWETMGTMAMLKYRVGMFASSHEALVNE